ncbi:MAG: membrane protein insertase YidC, partial [Rhodobacteraceae bacterium]|nr:membrane protein insertase YidC [Paracoccaceae bacterium]
MDDQNKNLILATVLSALVILGWLTFFPPEAPPPTTPAPVAGQTGQTGGDQVAPTPQAGAGAVAPVLTSTPAETREAALAK